MNTPSPTKIGDQLVEVGSAKEFKRSVTFSSVIQFENEQLKELILSAQDDQLLVVKSTIDSPKMIRAVEYYNEEFLSRVL